MFAVLCTVVPNAPGATCRGDNTVAPSLEFSTGISGTTMHASYTSDTRMSHPAVQTAYLHPSSGRQSATSGAVQASHVEIMSTERRGVDDIYVDTIDVVRCSPVALGGEGMGG